MLTRAHEPSTVLSPLYVGYRSSQAYAEQELQNALEWSTMSVPRVLEHRKVRTAGGDTKVPIAHVRSLSVIAPPGNTTCDFAVRCIDEVPGHPELRKVPLWVACVRSATQSGEFSPALPVGLTQLRIWLCTFEVYGGALMGAAQLALWRHLFVAALRAVDPNLVIAGHAGWDQEWWPVAP